MSLTESMNGCVEVRHSDIHGLGVFATAALPKDTLVGRYAGRRYAEDEVAEHEWDHEVTYAFGLSDGTTIDGGQEGNATRHLNHSCAPNCEAREIEDAQGQLQVEIYTRRRIKAGEELFIDYGLQSEGDAADYPCCCGARRCRGTLMASA